MLFEFNRLSMDVDFVSGVIKSIAVNGTERLAAPSPLYNIRLRDREGKSFCVSSFDAGSCVETDNGAFYGNFNGMSLTVNITLRNADGEAEWGISVKPDNGYFVEFVDFPSIILPALEDNNLNGDGGKILFPYNEGALISDITVRESSCFSHCDAEYPSRGWYSVFPNMVCSQMMAYIWDDAGLYIGAHDGKRGVKEIDFFRDENGVRMRLRLFCGVSFGEEFKTEYPIVFSVTEGRWEAAAERYRAWFESELPPKAVKISENRELPEWYGALPLVVSYPVRGIHDMDDMTPNKLYPYTNALPLLEEMKKCCDCRLLVLLMHWEGTAPWAPPYVWPPYGGEDNFTAFMNTLHENGDALGVYCSGFGYTIQSNLIQEYNKEVEYTKEELWRGMCASPDGRVAISNICTGQRSGYDICPASEVGRRILAEAYKPLFDSGIDYVQILDQNHGGGQYFCYSREHGHAPSPGAWMTEKMQEMLSEWNGVAKNKLFGCESAAAEPFIGNLLFSDNRYELNYMLGTPVPLYAYVYHEYLRNFMGNQVCCTFSTEEDTLRHRLAYSYCAGDCMTLVITPDGELMSSWGTRDFVNYPDKNKAFRLIANLTRAYRSGLAKYLYDGRMIPSPSVKCDKTVFHNQEKTREIFLTSVAYSAWEARDGSRALIVVNPDGIQRKCYVEGKMIEVPPLDVLSIEL